MLSFDERCKKIVELVREHESEGITKNQVVVTLSNDSYTGSRSTFADCFKHLLGQGDGKRLIELRREKNYKGHGRLFPTDTASKLADFKGKIRCAERLMDLVERHPYVGDFYHTLPTIKSNHTNQFTPLAERKIEFPIGKNSFSGRVYRLGARHDLLEKLPFFLISYVRDKGNGLASVESECIEMCNDVIRRCVSRPETFYGPYMSFVAYSVHNNFRADAFYDAKGVDFEELDSVFLKILGRYYFLVSMEFSDDFGIDSAEEQRTVSSFLREFFPRKRVRAKDGIDPYQYDAVSPIDLAIHVSTEIERRLMPGHSSAGIQDNPHVTRPRTRASEKDYGALLESMLSRDAVRLIPYEGEGKDDDPFGISEYYMYWMFCARIFPFDEMARTSLYFLSSWASEKYDAKQLTCKVNPALAAQVKKFMDAK